MFYRTSGQFKTTYESDQALFPIKQDMVLLVVILAAMYVVFPMFASEFTYKALLVPVLIYSLASLGLNILTGYAGQLSLGTAGFMGVGAYACYKITTIFPEMNIIVALFLSGFFSAAVGVAFGLPSLRIKGFYLAIATLASQFFLVWLFEKWAWLYNYNASGAIEVRTMDIFGLVVTGPNASPMVQYYFVLGIVSVVTFAMINLTRGRYGRTWKAVRDMDIAAELVGINLMRAKLSAFAVSSYIVGIAGALMVFFWKGAAEPNLFDIPMSFQIVFIAIIGGLGSVMGNFLGAILIVALPVVLNLLPEMLGLSIGSATMEHVNVMVVGSLIIMFLIVEPHGLARFWALIREKLIIWPFPH
ncbi:leucine/isoleucine/valine transporter permease subunit [Pseudovibrio sp. W64]|uniref:Branched-chain amino acid transport system permease protein n=1 Tax=Pseudovibrio ascidiaceicola TaxID=285279 RepID=A0A1I4AF32_9HYPH|nr:MULTISPECIES: branched-chain amino acid ABC transporter permease [Pseudovibrio]KZK83924.1 leucine/isoleucine/valine transporter permease subunit [Pseudovibrio sp. W64]KZK97060.1 leucine/isoleucine/valine transporter permease subunit [Pseudovibrio sp. Ad26]KZL01443.1 leucine/isoleucine/valine transporter permease subunit [Pseudovibrio sp. Ad5]SFK54551.1 branched-chain amino acid transport system permease protein [Pseudovibrio ascidiaceicola]